MVMKLNDEENISKNNESNDSQKRDQEREEKLEKKLDFETYQQLLEKYFKSYPGFFTNDGDKGVFLLGVVTSKLLRAQNDRYKLGNNVEPFWNSLYNLKLNKKRIMTLQIKVLSKLKFYHKYVFYPHNLIQAMSNYLMRAGKDFMLTDLEISWYFSHGLASYREVTNKNLELIESNKEVK